MMSGVYSLSLAASGDNQPNLKKMDENLPHIGDGGEKTLYVQNIATTWDKWELFHVFRRFGQIDDIEINKRPGKADFTSAYVHMLSVADANSAIAATAENNGKLMLPELTKPLRIQLMKHKKDGSSKAKQGTADKGDPEKVKSYFSIERPDEENSRKPIIYSDRCHRHTYLPWRREVKVDLIKPISGPVCWPFVFYVLTETTKNEAEDLVVTNEEFESQLAAHFKRAASVQHVTKDELLVAAPREPDTRPLRCRVLEQLCDDKVRVYALDSGQKMVVKMSELKVISEYLASLPARAIPCTLYGISKPTATFAPAATHMLESIDRLAVRVMSFDGAISVVRAFNLVLPAEEVAKMLADKGFCEYASPEKPRVYSRSAILSLREQEKELPIPNQEVAEAVSRKSRSLQRKSPEHESLQKKQN